jgi:tmRNA-binding protein
MKPSQVNIKNRRASFDYEIGETYTAGLVLTGTEIKSIRDGKAGLADTYVILTNGEAWVKGIFMALTITIAPAEIENYYSLAKSSVNSKKLKRTPVSLSYPLSYLYPTKDMPSY